MALLKNQKEISVKDVSFKSLKDLPPVLSVEQFGEVMGLSRATAFKAVKEKGFPSVRIGRRIVIPKEHFLKWIDSQAGVPLDG